MAGLWKRVCRRDKSITQQMPASNNPSYHVSYEAAYTHIHTYTLIGHIIFGYICRRRHMEDVRYRKTNVTGLTD